MSPDDGPIVLEDSDESRRLDHLAGQRGLFRHIPRWKHKVIDETVHPDRAFTNPSPARS